MNFTEEHSAILEKNMENWNTLSTSGFMRNLDRPVFNALQKVYNEAVGPERFTHWCGACVSEMVQRLYSQYIVWKLGQSSPIDDVPPAKVNRKDRRKAINHVQQKTPE